MDFNTATCNNTLCANEHMCCSCTSPAHGVLDKDGDDDLVCAWERAYRSEWAHLVKIGFPKVCQADQITEAPSHDLHAQCRHTTNTGRTGAA